MKLRIEASSITLRLQPEEIKTFYEKKAISQLTKMPGGTLEVVLEVTQESSIGVTIDYPLFTFTFPQALVSEWCQSNIVGYSRKYDQLILTIEKDLPRKLKR